MEKENYISKDLDTVNKELKSIELELKRQELNVQIEKEKNKRRMIWGVCIVVVFIITIAVVVANQKSKREAERIVIEQEEQFQNQMQSFYDDGVRYLASGKYSNAIDMFSQIVSDATCYNEAKHQIEVTKEKYLESVIAEADAEMANLEYSKALKIIQQGKAYGLDSKELIDKEREILDLYSQSVISIAVGYGVEGNYAAAANALDEYIKLDGSNPDIVGLRDEYRRLLDVQTANSMRAEGRYAEAIAYIKASAFSNDEEISNIYNDVVATYKSNLLENVNTVITSEGYEAAIRQLNQAVSILGYDDEIHQKIVTLEADKIKNEGYSGRMSTEKQTDTYEFTASIAGQYRLEIEDDNANASYRIIIEDTTGYELKNRSFSSSNGVTVEFEENRKYTIQLTQSAGFASYSLKINMPNAVRTISTTDRVLSGSITFEDQVESFVYIPDVSGVYRFDIEDNVADTRYRFYLCDSRGAELKNSSMSQGNGKTVELEAGERYTIELRQDYGFANYTLKIGVPKQISSINGNSFNGSITYEDQEDNYTYVAPATGQFIFTLSDDNNDARYRIMIVDDRGAELRNSSISSGNEKKVDLTAGSTYTVTIKQDYGFANYSVSITN